MNEPEKTKAPDRMYCSKNIDKSCTPYYMMASRVDDTDIAYVREDAFQGCGIRDLCHFLYSARKQADVDHKLIRELVDALEKSTRGLRFFADNKQGYASSLADANDKVLKQAKEINP